MESFFTFECPFCGQQIKCNEKMEGTAINCPQCNQEIVPSREIKDNRKKIGISSKPYKRQITKEITNYSEPDGTFKKPGITIIFNCLGIFYFILFIVMLFVESKRLLIAGSCLASSLFSFFFANITHGISKIVHNSSVIVELLKRQENK